MKIVVYKKVDTKNNLDLNNLRKLSFTLFKLKFLRQRIIRVINVVILIKYKTKQKGQKTFKINHEIKPNPIE